MNNKFFLAQTIAIAAAPLSVLLATMPAQAQTQTICRYDTESGFPNALGMRTYVSLTESEGNTTVTLDRFPSFVSNPENLEQQADVSEVRSLTLYDTTITDARQLLIDQPFYYAALMDTEVENLSVGFEEIDRTLGCGQVVIEPEPSETLSGETPSGEMPPGEMDISEEPSAEAPAPAETTPPTASPAPPATRSGPTVAELPNGNYRFVSADFENRIVSDEELSAADGNIFLFRKFDDAVTGVIRAIGSESDGFCIAGTVEGDTVTGTIMGDGAADFPETTVQEDGTVAIVFSLADFSQINAGTELPVESCP